jgi:autotransporter passenger strand-loop-strand repeat protein
MTILSTFEAVEGSTPVTGVTVVSGGYLDVFEWATARGTIVQNGGRVRVQDGGFLSNTTIGSGGSATIGTVYYEPQSSGSGITPPPAASVNNLTVSNGGLLIFANRSYLGTVTVLSGATVVLEGNKGLTIEKGAKVIQALLSQGMIARGTLVSGFAQNISAGGTSISAVVVGAAEIIYSGGRASGTSLREYATQFIEHGGTAVRVQTHKIGLRLTDCLIQDSQQMEAGNGSGLLLAYGRTVCADRTAFAAQYTG